MNKLVCLLGKSGSGKSTIEKELTNHNFSKIVSVTTRKKRDHEIDGYDYYFVSEDKYTAMLTGGKFFETAEYAGNRYGILNGEIHGKLKAGNCVAVVEPHGYYELINKLEKGVVVGVFVDANDYERLLATMERSGKNSTTEDLLSICDRFKSDNVKYSNSKKETHYTLYNNYGGEQSLEDMCLEIINFIEN